MMSNYHNQLASRLLEIRIINDEWRELTKRYGSKVAKELKKIAPGDPSILYDLSVVSLMDEGMAEKRAVTIVDNYSHKDWQQELKGAKPIIIYTINKAARKMAKEKGKNAFTEK